MDPADAFLLEMMALIDWMKAEGIPVPENDTERRLLVNQYLAMRKEDRFE